MISIWCFITMDDRARLYMWIFWAGFFPWGVWWNPLLNLKSRPSRESRIRTQLSWSARINLHLIRRRKEDTRRVWIGVFNTYPMNIYNERVSKLWKIYSSIFTKSCSQSNLQNICDDSNTPNINRFSIRLLKQNLWRHISWSTTSCLQHCSITNRGFKVYFRASTSCL